MKIELDFEERSVADTSSDPFTVDISGGIGPQGNKGDKGDKGDKGEDGSIGDFPNTLPSTPKLVAKVFGFASIELSWTYENKVYYNYEIYASKTQGFTPNSFDIIHAGQTTAFPIAAELK